ncbi:class I adenylate-forming enzyme family protein [Amycolatopsis anabasis]|uniref:class I adenylate-forming enzyme family protein n=1 Tax=Amycolatopsis anabasis TaxID=1840409 RepID=UPI00131CC868|nr:AMP-binding protein [Amycolatopsis anabasis]
MTQAVSSRTLGATATRAAHTWPDKAAVRFDGSAMTFRELHATALQFLGQFHRAGLGKGDALLVMLDNGLQFPAVAVGAALGGIVSVPVNTEYRGDTLRHIVGHSGAEAIVTSEKYLDRVLEVRPPSLRAVLVIDAERRSSDDGVDIAPVRLGEPGRPAAASELDEIAIMYTSGTTGRAKGGVVSHLHAFEYARRVADILELSEEDVYYAPLPLFHIAGLWAAFYACLQRGATCVLVPRFSVSRFWPDCREAAATKTFLLGAMAQFLYRSADDASSRDNTVRRAIVVPLIDEIDAFQRRFGVAVSTCYASTEVNLPLAPPSGRNLRKSAGLGRPCDGFTVRVVRKDGTEASAGEPGELWVRHKSAGVLLLRYHEDAAATDSLVVDGWHRSGDIVKFDEQGNFHFVDRLKDALRKRGENISSFEVESEIRSHPDVVECAVVGVASSATEQDVVAYVQLRPGASTTAAQIRDHVAARAPKFMVPDEVHVVDAFPTTPTGKIQKFKLRERAEHR